MNLSVASVNKAIREIKAYKEEFNYKVSIFIQKLGDLGIKVIEANRYSEGDSDAEGLRSEVVLDQSNGYVKATLILHGKDVAFIEFGAGKYYNGAVGSSPNPLGTKTTPQMLIGSYGKGHGKEDFWFYEDKESGLYIKSYGTKAARPMYEADKAIHDKYIEIAKEVFK